MPLRKFELLSLVGRKKHPEEAAAPPPSGTTSSISSRPPYPSSSGSSSSGYSGFHRSSAPLPPPAPPSVPVRDGFYSAVQYERLTPSVTQRPPVLGGASSAPSSSSGFPSSSSVQYERLVPPPASSSRLPSPQYERLTPSSATLPSPPVQYERLTPTTSPAGGATLMGGRSPMQFRQPSPGHGGMSPSPAIPPLHSARSASFPGGSTLPSPPVNLRSPVDLASGGAPPPPARADSLRRDRLGSSSARALPPIAENDVVMEGTPSDKSTPFSMVMEEWMSQLRTPTPDVMLLPSPFDFNRGTPTPVEKMEDIRHIHEALLPTPPPLASESPNDLRQGTKTTEYVTSSNPRRPLVEDIASLCRDLISQEVSQQLAIRLKKMGAFPPNSMPTTNSEKVPRIPAMARTVSTAAADEDDDDDESQFDDSTSVGGSAAGGNGSAKGKRRKMCTAEGCQNLSRSRGLCKAHGGGRRCSVDGCSRASQSGSLCITHGGGKRCTVDGCMKAAQSRGMCKAHGGGVRCRVEGCTKSSQGDGFCRTHGGGRRCGYEGGCQKWAQRNGMCMAHSEGRYGNSYRGRVARSAGADAEQQLAAQTLVGAAKASVY